MQKHLVTTAPPIHTIDLSGAARLRRIRVWVATTGAIRRGVERRNWREIGHRVHIHGEFLPGCHVLLHTMDIDVYLKLNKIRLL